MTVAATLEPAQMKINNSYERTHACAGADAYSRDDAGHTALDVAENMMTHAHTYMGTGTGTGANNATRTCEHVLRDAMGLPSPGEDVFISHILIKHKVRVCFGVYARAIDSLVQRVRDG